MPVDPALITANLRLGMNAERALVVGEEHTAVRWGSSSGVAVFATPEMVALMEGAAVDTVDPHLPEAYCTVGTLVNITHSAATAVGRPVRAHATLTTVEGRKLTFRVEAYDDAGLIGEGTHERFVIELARFMQKAAARRTP
jgi:predicted thioesterase